MDTARLKEYLSIVVDMEKEIYVQESVIRSLQAQINRPEPVYKPYTPLPPHSELYQRHSLSSYIWLIVAFVVFVLATIISIALLVNTMNTGFIILMLIFGAIAIILGRKLPTTIHAMKVTIECNKSTVERWYTDWHYYNKSCDEEKQKAKEYAQKIDKWRSKKEILISSLHFLNEQVNTSKKTLECIYAENIIKPQYRNFIMVCTIYEYFSSGRCSTLEGHEGAYNILAFETALNTIITKLDEIDSKLESIRQGQHMLYSAIQEANLHSKEMISQIEHMSSSLSERLDNISNQENLFHEQILRDSGLASYHIKCLEKEVAYRNRMDYISGRNDNILFNEPFML